MVGKFSHLSNDDNQKTAHDSNYLMGTMLERYDIEKLSSSIATGTWFFQLQITCKVGFSLAIKFIVKQT